MKPTDFAKYLSDYLGIYLPKQQNLSNHTLASYRDTFKLFLLFCRDEKQIKIEYLSFLIINDSLIKDYLNWVEKERNCCIATRNVRLAAIHSFFRYVQMEMPDKLFCYQKILSIPFKKAPKSSVGYLTVEELKILFQQPDLYTKKGRRDLTLLSTLYDTGARVQEMIDLKVSDIRIDKPATITLTGKGMRARNVPITENTKQLLIKYLEEQNLTDSGKKMFPVFFNRQKNKLSRAGIAYILKKYATIARKNLPHFKEKISPHIIRHSKAMHLLQAGINLIYIRDLLGHSQLTTTDIYARANIEMKRESLEKVYPELLKTDLPDWNKDESLLNWLTELK